MKITKQQLKQIILKEFKVYTNAPPEASDDSEEQTKETLLDRLGTLLQEWPACEEKPEGMACKYHKDLEEVVIEYGREGCGPGTHDAGEGIESKSIEEA